MNARVDLPLGVVPDMPAATYHSIHALSAGGLKRLRQSPAHFYAAQLDPNKAHGDPTPAMKAGTLAHCALLEPVELAMRYIVKPADFDGRTKEGKAWTASIMPGQETITAEQMQTALRQAAAVRALPEVAALLSRGRPEVSSFWFDPATGEHCKCRPDWESPAGDGVILLDLKTCQDASPAGFARSVVNFAYHLQAAHYSDGHAMASGLPVLGFVFACVEAEYPHAAAAYMLDDDAMSKARAKNRELADLYATCKASNTWTGYPDTIQPLSLPAWAS